MTDLIEVSHKSFALNAGLLAGSLGEAAKAAQAIVYNKDATRLMIDTAVTGLALAANGILTSDISSPAVKLQNNLLAGQMGLNIGSLLNSIFSGENIWESPLVYGALPAALMGFAGERILGFFGLPNILNPERVYQSAHAFGQMTTNVVSFIRTR